MHANDIQTANADDDSYAHPAPALPQHGSVVAGSCSTALHRKGRTGMRRAQGHQVVGLDVLGSPFTTMTGSIVDRRVIRQALRGVTRLLHAATLHKPHIGSHTRQDFIDTNVTGTLTLLEEAAAAGVRSVMFTSSTSAFGRALSPAHGQPAAWITEEVTPRVRNIYGATKVAAEDLCELAAGELGLPVVVLRTSRFFPEQDDRDDVRMAYDDTNLKVNEFLYRRVDLSDVVDAHLLAAERPPDLRFGRYIISATTPFAPHDLAELALDAPAGGTRPRRIRACVAT